jgi:hypothetical protein
MNAFGGAAAWKDVGDPSFAHVYRETSIATTHGATLRVVGTTSTSLGPTAAAIVTTQLIFQYTPRIVLMIGIAAGTRSGNKRLRFLKGSPLTWELALHGLLTQHLRRPGLHYDAYDQTNASSHMKRIASEVSGSAKAEAYLLTARGLAAAAETIKEIVSSKH